MATIKSQHANINGFLDEHEKLREILESIRDTIAQQQASAQTVCDLLAELQTNIQVHFEHEEEDQGFFSQVMSEAPRLTGRAESLMNQHQRLNERLERMQQYTKTGDRTDDWWTELRIQFDVFVSRFAEHEQAEHTLMQEVFNQDIGAED